MLIAYFAPEVALPVTSALTAIVGFVLLVGRSPFRAGMWLVRRGTSGVKGVWGCTVRPSRPLARPSVPVLTGQEKSGKKPAI